LHAALASYVAGWESYIERLITNFYAEAIDIGIRKFVALHSVLQVLGQRATDRFNSPNAKNTRALLVEYTGYDPINDWAWANMSGPMVRERLNQIIRVRHSFAHGFAMPAFHWNTSNTGQARLTREIILAAERFFIRLVERTDDGMRDHIRSNYNPNLLW